MNLVKINLITWEKNPRMRAKNNQISFLADRDAIFGEDILLHTSELNGESLTYEINEIKSYKPSTISGKYYIVATVKCLRTKQNDRSKGSNKD